MRLGLLSCYCSKHQQARTTALDADPHVFPFLKLHAKINNVQVTTTTGRYEAIPKRLLKQQDLVLGADICFWNELGKAVFEMIKHCASNGVKQVIIADPGRAPFYWLEKQCLKAWPKSETIERHLQSPFKGAGYLLIVNF